MKHSSGGYAEGCRCEICMAARREYQREYRAQRNPKSTWPDTPEALPDKRRDTRRVYDEGGQLRCNKCGEFKTLAEMVWHKSKRGRMLPETCCTECKRADDRARPRDRKPYQHDERAAYRAARQLVANHPEEYERLLAAATADVDGLELLGFQRVREHLRAVYGEAKS